MWLRKIFPEISPARHNAHSKAMAFKAPLVVRTTADRPKMALIT